MLNNIYILRRIVKELNQYVGCKVIDCFTNKLGILHFELYDGRTTFLLNISLITEFEAIFVTKIDNKPKKSAFRLFHSIIGEIIQSIEIFPNNRLIKIELINLNLFLQIFGKSQNNIILTNKSGLIIDAYKNKKELIATHYLPTKPVHLSLKDLPKNEKLIKALSTSEFLLGKYFSMDLLLKLNLDPYITLSDLSDEDIRNVERYARNFVSQIEQSSYFYYLKNEQNQKIFSPIRLTQFPIIIYEGDNMFELIKRVFIDRLNNFRFEKLSKSLANIDEKYLKKYESKIKRYNEIPKLNNLIDQYQKYTDLLYTLPDLKQKGIDRVKLKDFDGNEIVIPLEPKFSIIQNIEKYFSKIKKIKRDIEIIEKNHSAIINEYNIHNQRYNELNSIVDYYNLKKFYKQNINFYKKNMQIIPKEPSEKFRKFEIASNAILYVGKDSKNNDELTFCFGKPNDYWFHLRGGSGSHCILKYTGEGIPAKEIIEKCASIAAYYSSQRNGGFVPVIYTQRKYVRKPKRANPGTVIVSKEEVILVEPKSYDEIN